MKPKPSPPALPARLPRAKGRSWTLGGLPRDVDNTLWFDLEENRWQVTPAGSDKPLRLPGR